MKWVVLVYLAMFAGTSADDMRYTRLEFPANDYWECTKVANELNDIETAYRSKTSYVRSFYWVYINLAHKIKAECVYADPEAPLPRWADDFVGTTWYNKNEAYEPGENDIDEDKP